MSGSNVCSDLMVDIFERLPPKSIIRFRSLSKYWHSHLVSPEFISRHRFQCSKNPPKVLIRHVNFSRNYGFKDIYTIHLVDQLPLDPGCGYLGIPGVEFPYPRARFRDLSPVGSCNGILCLHEKDNFSLWNLSIRRRLIVPRHPLMKSFSELALGFGFDLITDDYKIVAVSYESDANNTYIYSLKTESWSVIPSPSTPIYNVWSNACFFNGILHWLVDGYAPTESTTKKTRFILTFNLSSYVFGRIVLPEPWLITQLATINGCLAVVSLKGGYFWESGCFWIRAMKEYDKTESLYVLFKMEREAFSVITVLQPFTNGDLLAFYEGSKVYNPQTRLFTKLLGFGHNCFRLEMDTYVESLELVDKESTTTCGKTVYSMTKKD